MTTHPSGCRCDGLDRVCPEWKRVYGIVDAGLTSPDPALRAISEAAVASVRHGESNSERAIQSAVLVSEGMTMVEAIRATGYLTLEERKAMVRERWEALVGSRK